ncbi:hypothetical protein [Roseibium sp. Sym1]|uniref:hypothetical protein n=1 Tax=Roseibium sp. Sym1 TaxID=3016006 RepID=UPI0022B3E6D1|nr:hypothetical protein [Roseibium sp. Sym1]
METLGQILKQKNTKALLIGNGINRYQNNTQSSSWESLLQQIASAQSLRFTKQQLQEMSNTEFFDILDLAQPEEDRRNLQQKFCELMSGWEPQSHHAKIIGWARNRSAPVVTVNFDENLSKSVGAKYFGPGTRKGFTDYYPWSSYFSDEPIGNPRTSFAIYHAHGMRRYSRSIRLGLTHYMGAVQRARSWVYGKRGIRMNAKEMRTDWPGSNTWLEPILFSPLIILGFGFGKDETFLRWLFLERARLHKMKPDWKQKAWYVTNKQSGNSDRAPFFKALGINLIETESYEEIYENPEWNP